jgi:hypothetical protein
VDEKSDRAWRASHLNLTEEERGHWIAQLIKARRAVHSAPGNPDQLAIPRRAIHETKCALGERGPVWWTDGAPDLNWRLAKNSSYSGWWLEQQNS